MGSTSSGSSSSLSSPPETTMAPTSSSTAWVDDWDSLGHVAYGLPHAGLYCTAPGVSHKVPNLEHEP
jgi:hypothetical protein